MFLVAMIATAEKGKDTFQKILALRNDVEKKNPGWDGGPRTATGRWCCYRRFLW